MTKLSAKVRYGVLLMLELAEGYGKGPLSLREISKRNDISEKYLWHLIRMLKNSGLVRSTQGARGGYGLGRPVDQISLKDILSVLEGPLDVDGTDAGSLKSCDRIVREMWEEVSGKISDIFISYTLKDMVAMRQSRHANDYSI